MNTDYKPLPVTNRPQTVNEPNILIQIQQTHELLSKTQETIEEILATQQQSLSDITRAITDISSSLQQLITLQSDHLPNISHDTAELASTVDGSVTGLRKRIVVHNPPGEPIAVVGV
jgi:uncharacterized protein YoxC